MGFKLQTIKDIKLYLATELESVYPSQEIEAIGRIITSHVTGYQKLYQIHDPSLIITEEEQNRIEEICRELKTGKPLQYITGETYFYDCLIKVNRSALIPRPETEELVDLIIRENRDFKGKITDIGTGTGCIAIALSINLPLAEVTGTDISDDAIILARQNALLNKANVKFVKNNILGEYEPAINKSDLIVSNPPYVRDSEKQFMNRNVLDFEPAGALFVDDSDPLLFYRAILKKAERMLLPKGKIYFEINEALGDEMVELLQFFNYRDVEKIKDLNGRDRIIKGRKNE